MNGYQFSEEERAILEGMPQALGVYQVLEGWIEPLVLSNGFIQLFGYKDREDALQVTSHDLFEFFHPDDAARVEAASRRFAREEGSYDVYYRTKQRTGSEYMVIHATGEIVTKENGVKIGYVWYTNEGLYTRDADDRAGVFRRSIYDALHEESLVNASRYNTLTGLPGMTYFFELADTWKEKRKNEEGPIVLLYFNLHGMKIFNTKYSFAEGDRLLKEFGAVLEKTFERNHCCHIAADQFAAFTAEEEIEAVLQNLFQECRNLNGGNTLPVHVGIYSITMEDVPVSTACDRAKFACDSMKNTYESGFHYYDNDLREEAFWRQYILSHLDQALSEKWIQVYYQPLVRAVSGKVCNEEALSRWNDPKWNLLSPVDFIPFLEEAGMIYKLDLYVVEQVLEKLRIQEKAGCSLVPQTVNLSRSDFDACDMVEEIRKRVDASGIGRDKLVIEITESTMGKDADFMRKQTDRFRELGFSVWLDDFGSGYSSLEVLQTMKVDLLKFDMSFMRRFDEGEEGKIILNELIRMATSLGIDTACEGVEREEQARFLRDSGCARLQGYYYSKPVPLETVLEYCGKDSWIGYEDPEESGYYEAISRANLYDLGIIGNQMDHAVRRAFNSLPMGIIEVNETGGQFMRSNQSYRDFMNRLFSIRLADIAMENPDPAGKPSAPFYSLINQCIHTSDPVFLDEDLPDGSVVHSFARKIAEDPKNGKFAVAVAVLSVTDAEQGTTYEKIARALAADYYNIYYVDLDTDQFIEYSSPVGGHDLAMERHGEHFFEAARRDTMVRIYEEDREFFLTGFTKENILKTLEKQGVFTTSYRLIDTGTPMQVTMKIMRMSAGSNALILGISITDSEIKSKVEG